MKQHRTRITLLLTMVLFVSMLLATVTAASGAASYEEAPSTFADFPGYPQLTEAELASSTEELTCLLLQNRYVKEWGVSNRGSDHYYQFLRKFFNGISELESRTDAAEALLVLYEQTLQGDTHFWTEDILFLLSQPIYEQAIPESKKSLLSEAIRQFRQTFGPTVQTTTSGVLAAPQSISTILTTACGNTVTATIYDSDMSEEAKKRCIEEAKASNPNATLLSSPTWRYNCHSYAWYSTSSTSNIYWINNPQPYINDPHCVEVSRSQAGPSTLVVYYEGNTILHSAVIEHVSGSQILCFSKWGSWGLYSHAIDDVPLDYMDNGTVNVRFYEYVRSPHQFQYTYTAGTHTGTCSICRQAQSSPHIARVISTTQTSHTMGCTVCSFAKTEAHTVDTVRNICTVCRRSGPFPSIINKLLPILPANSEDPCQNHREEPLDPFEWLPAA